MFGNAFSGEIIILFKTQEIVKRKQLFLQIGLNQIHTNYIVYTMLFLKSNFYFLWMAIIIFSIVAVADH